MSIFDRRDRGDQRLHPWLMATTVGIWAVWLLLLLQALL